MVRSVAGETVPNERGRDGGVGKGRWETGGNPSERSKRPLQKMVRA